MAGAAWWVLWLIEIKALSCWLTAWMVQLVGLRAMEVLVLKPASVQLEINTLMTVITND